MTFNVKVVENSSILEILSKNVVQQIFDVRYNRVSLLGLCEIEIF